METIRNYLETMFAGLPASAEVKKAKEELLAMMEDKYTELIADGKAENEAVATVIADFGNLNDISETLGISNVLEETKDEEPSRQITMDEAKAYLAATSKNAFLKGLGIFLLITCPTWTIFGDMLAEAGSFKAANPMGAAAFFMALAAGVCIIVYASFLMKEWAFAKKTKCFLDYQTAEYVKGKEKETRTGMLMLRVAGVFCCACCFVPAIIFDSMGDYVVFDERGGAMFFIMAGAGVWMLVTSAGKAAAYKRLLGMNPEGTMARTYVAEEEEAEQKEEYKTPAMKVIMDNYWFTVGCLFVCISFLTFKWGVTWIIWPVATVIYVLLRVFFKKEAE